MNLTEYVMKDLVWEYIVTKNEMDAIDAEAGVRDLLRETYSDHVYEIVDGQGMEFDEVIFEVLDEVVCRAER